MIRKIKYKNESMRAKFINDFLPPPEQMFTRDEDVKVTVTLSRNSIEFFKAEADKYHTQYQHMISRLLDDYVEQHKS